MKNDQDIIKRSIGDNCLLEQLAEEATELAQAALKLARIRRGENPTPVKEADAAAHLVEEFTDLTLAADILGLKSNDRLYNSKLNRWSDRIIDMERRK